MTRPACLVLACLLPAGARAGAGLAGMGGVGVGLPDARGELADNPATAAASGLDRTEGVVRVSGGLVQLGFAGRIYHGSEPTVASFTEGFGLGWTAVSPVLGEGRVGGGVWQVDRHALELDEPLDLSLPAGPGGPALAGSLASGVTRVAEDEGLYAAGATWIQPVGQTGQQLAAGVAYLNLTGRSGLKVVGSSAQDGGTVELRDLAGRRSLNGFGVLLGYFYRPLPGGSLGVSAFWIGPMSGHVWRQDGTEPLRRDVWERPAQLRIALGGGFTLADRLTLALDLKYAGETRSSATLFRGTADQRAVVEATDVTFAVHFGAEYRLALPRRELPVRVGVFLKPDPLGASVAPAAGAAVSAFDLPSVRQDATGFTLGTGWEREGLGADLGLQWVLLTTHTRLPGASGISIDSGDVRSTFGAVATVTMRFGGPAVK